jgi:hypothetical protein
MRRTWCSTSALAPPGAAFAVSIAGVWVTGEAGVFTLTIVDRDSGVPVWNDREAIGSFSSKGP